MVDSENKIKEFLLDVKERIDGFQGAFKDPAYLDSLPLVPGQAIYVFNWKDDTKIYQKGIEELLGYEKEEFTQELITTYFHPDDADIVLRLIKGAVNYVINNPVSLHDFVLSLTFRVRKRNGEYIKVLRQSAMFDLSVEKHMISNYSMLSDISFMDTGNKVAWNIQAKKLVKEEFEKYIYEAYKDFFSVRENEILNKLKNGNSSKQIADKLYISSHTVDTHRRKMLQKTGCRNTVELLNFAKKSGNI